jgi:glycosyltransferase involved in cell wall biosynthesis
VGQKVIVNVDGIERKRKKWNVIGKLWYLFGEVFSCIFPNRIVTDAKVIQEYYMNRYRKDSTFIPYGTNTIKKEGIETIQKLGLEKEGYILYVSRLEPENNAHIVIKAFEWVRTDKKLVIVGDAPYSKKYIEGLKKTKDRRILFTGFIFGKGYWELQSHAYCYVHATEVGGTHPALVEAMGMGNCVVVNGTPENIEVLGDTGIIYKKNDYQDLSSKLQSILDNPEMRFFYKEKALQRARERYSWDSITDRYESLFLALLKKLITHSKTPPFLI